MARLETSSLIRLAPQHLARPSPSRFLHCSNGECPQRSNVFGELDIPRASHPPKRAHEQQETSAQYSWITRHSRTHTSSISAACFNFSVGPHGQGVGDISTTLRELRLRHCPANALEHQQRVGEGETFIVERCSMGQDVVAVKHLKLDQTTSDPRNFQRRLESVLLELRIMRHSPLRDHPNILNLVAYGYNTHRVQLLPYIVVEYSPYGTIRDYLESHPEVYRSSKEILLGDVAAWLQVLHTSQIVHGDVKAEHVLIFPSLDRPCAAIAKLCDFGHSLLLQSALPNGKHLQYKGTDIYNAPEVQKQPTGPIERHYLLKCDVWAFGLLALEVFLHGKRYDIHFSLPSMPKESTEQDEWFNNLLAIAQRSPEISGRNLEWALIRLLLAKTLKLDPDDRVSSLTTLHIMKNWQLVRAELDLQIFNFDRETEVPWDHQKHIVLGFQNCYDSASSNTTLAATCAWQLAMCCTLGFGTSRDPTAAALWTQRAATAGHSVANFFLSTLSSTIKGSISCHPYLVFLKDSFRAVAESDTEAHPDDALCRACRTGCTSLVVNALARGANPTRPFPDGTNILHWLFMFDSKCNEWEELESQLMKWKEKLPLNQACPSIHTVHKQWPLELTGSPLTVSVSVHDVQSMRFLLLLGANPLARAYNTNDSSGRHRAQRNWTPLHVAVKYHNASMLRQLLAVAKTVGVPDNLSCALSFSSPLERRALHLSGEKENLRETIELLSKASSLNIASSESMTPLMQAIDFDDLPVVEAILEHDPSLAMLPNVNPQNAEELDYPIIFAAQAAARRDIPESTAIMQHLHSLNPDVLHLRDSLGRTCLHMAVTGSSLYSAEFILEKSPHLLRAKDKFKRSPLFYCTSETVCDFLTRKGVEVNAVDQTGMSAVHFAIQEGRIAIVGALSRHRGVDLNLKSNNAWTPLHLAVWKKSREMVLSLLTGGAKTDAVDRFGHTPLDIAAREGSRHMTSILLESGAPEGITNNLGETPFYSALRHGNFSSLQAFITSGRFPLANVPLDDEGNTSIHLCARFGNDEMMEFLLEKTLPAKAKISSLLNFTFQTPLHIAAMYSNADICTTLLRNCLDIQDRLCLARAKDLEMNSAVHYAIRGVQSGLVPPVGECLQILRLLKAQNTLFFEPNNLQETPWDLALSTGYWRNAHLDILAYLLSHWGLKCCRYLFDSTGNPRGNELFAAAWDKKDVSFARDLIRSSCVSLDVIPRELHPTDDDPESPRELIVEALIARDSRKEVLRKTTIVVTSNY
ncbi:ankyrin repeat domain protein [Diplodia corticola]|uniref:Ankyrin repeat domain protein n=1 Tax=Diplodia corticola TaxID=236234 RepID=A0A1J9RK64_9PEZI|nr:ankyrin repeat domain protein [Diplodia corticola]OJD40378.1 ankyrin repeat domain protein [Diplodia corticola]